MSLDLSIFPAINNLEHARTPQGLENLKTFSGGNRHLKRFDPRIKMLWRLLVNHCDPQSFTVIYTKECLADLLSISPRTVARWLNFFENRGWIERPRRYGGRGQGNEILLVWLQRGADLAARRERAESYQKAKREKHEQNKANYQRVTQGQTTLYSYGDLINRAMPEARTTLKRLIQNPIYARHAASAFGLWVKQQQPSQEHISTFLDRLRDRKRLVVPRWVKAIPDVYRWIKGMITNMLIHPNWFEKLEARLEMKLISRQLKRIKQAIEKGASCPTCGEQHTRDDFEYGADENDKTNCIGLLRVKRGDYLEIWHRFAARRRQETPA